MDVAVQYSCPRSGEDYPSNRRRENRHGHCHDQYRVESIAAGQICAFGQKRQPKCNRQTDCQRSAGVHERIEKQSPRGASASKFGVVFKRDISGIER